MLRHTRVFLTLVITATLLAGPAFGHGNKWRRHRHHDHHRNHYAPHYAKHQRGYPVYRHGNAAEAYYCGPCRRHFDGYDDLSYHVHKRHHVARVELPFLILHGTIGHGFGWVFHP